MTKRRRMARFVVGTLATWLLLAGSGQALEDRKGRWEAGAQAGGFLVDDRAQMNNTTVGMENNWVFGARLGYWLTQALEPELAADYVPTENPEIHNDATILQGHIDALYHFNTAGRLTPYLMLGGGMTRYDADAWRGGADWRAMANYGAGLKYWFTDNLAARLDVRQPVTFERALHDARFNTMYTLGVSWLFSAAAPAPAPEPEPAPAPPPPPPPAPMAAPAPAPRAPAPSATLTANPASIQQGQTSTLSWQTQEANDVSISNIGPVSASGTRAVSPSQSTTYRLVAKGPGGSRDAEAEVTVVPAIQGDADRDGVPDAQDKCPGTPAGMQVDSTGCPLDTDKDGVYDSQDKCPGTPVGTPVDSVGCPLDSDKDGVYDSQDKCPGTPAGTPVDSVGCPLDSDGDGVYDSQDKCPGTPKGTVVDATGCPPPVPAAAPAPKKAPQVVELKVYFDTDKSDVKPQYMDQIQKVADFMKENPNLTAVIEGHTDNVGSEEYNLKLSTRRANAVAKILTEKFGIPVDRISAQSLGETKPVASNKTAEGRAQNRRVYAILETE